MGRGVAVIKRCSAFLTPQVLQALVLSNLDYCPVVWSSAARKYLVKLQLAQNRAAHFALHCNQRANINNMHASLSWLRVEERLTASLLVFIRNIVLKIPFFFAVNLHTALTHTLIPPDMPPGSFHSPQIQNKFKEKYNIIQSHECMELPSILYKHK